METTTLKILNRELAERQRIFEAMNLLPYINDSEWNSFTREKEMIQEQILDIQKSILTLKPNYHARNF